MRVVSPALGTALLLPLVTHRAPARVTMLSGYPEFDYVLTPRYKGITVLSEARARATCRASPSALSCLKWRDVSRAAPSRDR